MNKKVYGYARVSTAKQGEGVSLQEQRKSIEQYAIKHDLNIVQWFEEKETAAKQGRPAFNKMLSLLKKKKAAGVIIHKIDRSARNLKDWAEMGDLVDAGIEVHFSFETIDFNTRGGRLAADIQAVFAADYVRNLRQETIKGLNGRLSQGIFPFFAPIGYLNTGAGNPKKIDEEKAPLIRKAFELYSTGEWSIISLSKKMYELGLRNSKGGRVTRNGISHILNNPFYIGIIKIRRTGKVYDGVHLPIISQSLFDKVQTVLHGKTQVKKVTHDFVYRRKISCGHCDRKLVPERQKGHIYYRCRIRECPTKTVREEMIEKSVMAFLAKISFSENEAQEIKLALDKEAKNFRAKSKQKIEHLQLQKSKLDAQLNTLTDKLIEGVIEDDVYTEKKEQILNKKKLTDDNLELLNNPPKTPEQVLNLIECLKDVDQTYSELECEPKKALLSTITANLSYKDKKLYISTHPAFSFVHLREDALTSAHSRAAQRTIAVDSKNITTKRNKKTKNYLKTVACSLLASQSHA